MTNRWINSNVIRAAVVIMCAVSFAACTVVNTAVLPNNPNVRTPFVTTGDIQGPYQSLGLIQITRKGHMLFGFVDLVGTDLQSGFGETLLPEIQRLGGDGAINVRFHQSQPLPFTKVVQAIFFVVPFLWTHVTITAEVVKLQPGQAMQPAQSPGT